MTIVSSGRVAAVTADIEIITPDIARQYLTQNIANNRKKKDAKITAYARDIRSGGWVLTGEAIKFDEDGNLVDGQNRLSAVIVADTAAAFLVVRGISREAVALLDSGTSRSGADALTIAGVVGHADAKDLAAAARLHRAYMMGDIVHAMSTLGGSAQLTKRELIDYLGRNPHLDFAARFGRGVYKSLPVPISSLAVAYDVFSRLNVDDTAEFFNRIRDGISAGIGDPFLTLSRRVAADRAEGVRNISASTGLYYLFRTWNAFRASEPMNRLQVGTKQNGWTTMPVPK